MSEQMSMRITTSGIRKPVSSLLKLTLMKSTKVRKASLRLGLTNAMDLATRTEHYISGVVDTTEKLENF